MKRNREAEESSSDDFGPVPQQMHLEGKSTAERRPTKKIRRAQFERLFLASLPEARLYEKSYMHRDFVTHTAVTSSDFILTASIDGHVKFWKKQPEGIEFVKSYSYAHQGPIVAIEVSSDGMYAASVSQDQTVKIYDVLNFDMVTIIDLGFTPLAAAWIYQGQADRPLLAVSSSDEKIPHLYIYDSLRVEKSEDGLTEPLEVIAGLHKAPVKVMSYNSKYDTVISIDKKGLIEYWTATIDSAFKDDVKAHKRHPFPFNHVSFTLKSSTDLFEFAKSQTTPTSLAISADGSLFATMGMDRQIRVFRFVSGKLYRKYDESLLHYANVQKNENSLHKLEAIDFGRRNAVETQLEKAWEEDQATSANVIFDSSGQFVMYPSMVGIKLVSLVSNKLVRRIGQDENSDRFLHLALYQGKNTGTVAQGNLVAKAEQDPTIFATAFKKHRFYLFTRREPAQGDDMLGRDVFNEKPLQSEIRHKPKEEKRTRLAQSAIIHTTMGDIHLDLYGSKTPLAVENFTMHSQNKYYNGTIVHRVIRSFMIQMGDPLGDGTGGTSIWGKNFKDEFHPDLRHDAPFTVSMANAGPNTNGSQFFITTVPTPHLNDRHTVFGRVTKGMDVVSSIERVPVNRKYDKPWEDIKIINIDVHV